jgi:anthranilate phosphoribosyltransferase
MHTMQQAIVNIMNCRDLGTDEAMDAMKVIMAGNATPAQIGGFLIGLRMKGEKSHEIASFAQVMRSFAVPVPLTTGGLLVDTCGTGGDGAHTFNISTTAAFVTAGAGVPVVKHGNRSISSRCGSADVLEELGVNLTPDPRYIRMILEKTNIAFLYAPLYHPAMKHAMGPRKELGVRTVFNLLGPLSNPAGAQAQLLGVYAPELVLTMADVLRILGLKKGMVVHGDGLDEITTTGPTTVSELTDGKIRSYQICCEDYGIRKGSKEDLKGGDARMNARILKDVLLGQKGAARDIVILNAGAAIYLGERAATLEDGITLASESIDSGRAYETLRILVRESGDVQ